MGALRGEYALLERSGVGDYTGCRGSLLLVCKRIIGEKAVRGGIPWSEYLMLAEIDVLWGNIAELMQK